MSPEHRVKQEVKRTFPPHPIKGSVIHSTVLRPEAVTAICRAGMDGDSRWVVSGLKGKAHDTQPGIAPVTDKTIGVDPVIGGIVEG